MAKCCLVDSSYNQVHGFMGGMLMFWLKGTFLSSEWMNEWMKHAQITENPIKLDLCTFYFIFLHFKCTLLIFIVWTTTAETFLKCLCCIEVINKIIRVWNYLWMRIFLAGRTITLKQLNVQLYEQLYHHCAYIWQTPNLHFHALLI